MIKVDVLISAVVTVEYSDDTDDHTIQFDIEENHCPGTGRVGSAVDKMIEEHETTGHCAWCNHQGTNKIMAIRR